MALLATLLLLPAMLFTVVTSSGTRTIKWVDCAQHTPTTPLGAKVDINALPSTLRCGQFVVPMDYSKPLGPGNNITLGLAMVRPQKPRGVIFHSPGGTDEATIFAWQAALNITQVFAGLEDYDLMMMDVRGTYSSNPLDVSLSALGNITIDYPSTETQFQKLKKMSQTGFASWIEKSSPPGIIQHVGTREVMQDLEMIRKALGYEKINFIGSSYGSYRAAQYASMFPQHVENFVLDAVVPHQDVLSEVSDMVAAVNRVLERADAFCQNNATCPFSGRGAIQQLFKQIVKQAKANPIAAKSCASASSACITPVTANNIRNGLLNLLSGDPDFPILFEALNAAIAGDASIFAEYAGDPIPDIAPVWSMPLECNDWDIGNNTFESFQNSFRTATNLDTYGVGKTQGWTILIICSGWPFQPVKQVKLTEYDGPILLLTSDFDPNSPTEWARNAWRKYPNASLVIRHGDNHVSFQAATQDSAAVNIAKEFLRTGKLPAPRNETLVSVYSSGMDLPPVANPYDVPTGAIAGDVDSS